MNLSDAISYIENINNSNTGTEFNNIKELLEKFYNPQNDLKFVHIAGTNGKGTVTHCLAHILKENGYKVGLTVSPHILDFRERIQINGKFIEGSSLINLVKELQPILDDFRSRNIVFSQFSIITVLALKYFSDQKCDIVCIEAGLGGRLDPTNVIENVICSVITKISLDHQNILGENIVDIALEKAGIIKRGTDLVLYKPTEKIVLNIIKKVAKKNKTKLHIVDFRGLRYLNTTMHSNIFIYNGNSFRLKYVGRIMPKNIAVVIDTLYVLSKKDFNIDFRGLYKYIYTLQLEGRMEVINSVDRSIILDGCHNPDGVYALCDFIDYMEFDIKEPTAIIAVSKDKDAKEMIDELRHSFTKVYVTTYNDNRSLCETEISKIIKEIDDDIITYINFDDIPFNDIKKINPISNLFAFCGSFYFISDVKKKGIK